VLLGVTLLTLLVPLMEGRALGWPVWCWVLLAISPIAGTAFVLAERRLEAAGGVPLVPPSLIRVPSMRRGLLLGVPLFVGFGGFMFVYAVALQIGIHLGPLESGAALAPMGVSFLAASLMTARLLNRYGRGVITAGALLQTVGLLVLVLTALAGWPHLTPLDLAPGMIIAGYGQGLLMSPLFRVVLSDVPAERAGIGSGVLVTTQQSALALGVATLGSLFLSLAAASKLGTRDAFVVVLLVQAFIALLTAAGSRGLPRNPHVAQG